MTVSIISLPAGKEFFIKKNIITLGRDKNNDVAIIKNSFVSRKHCQINFRDNKYFVEDLNSQNGTYVNGELIEAPVELKNNDTITLSVKGPIFQFKTYSESEKNSNNSTSKIKIILKKILKNTEIKNNLLFRLIGILIIFIIITSLFFFRTKIYLSLIDDEVKKEFIRVMLKYGEKNFPTNGEFIEKIRNYINVYKNSKDFREGLKRRKNYIKMIEKIFKKHKIPVDLSYLAFVESNYKPHAYNSQSGAKGMWQFMPATARQYGLIVNKNIDERTDTKKSTEAAGAYINDLLSIFGVDSFTIAIAAYNAGDGFLRLSLTKIKDPKKDRNFWYLYKNNLIPKETQEYVLKVLALMILCENLDRK